MHQEVDDDERRDDDIHDTGKNEASSQPITESSSVGIFKKQCA
jgi:hypothetical protein